jgi:hypothetical protein
MQKQNVKFEIFLLSTKKRKFIPNFLYQTKVNKILNYYNIQIYSIKFSFYRMIISNFLSNNNLFQFYKKIFF